MERAADNCPWQSIRAPCKLQTCSVHDMTVLLYLSPSRETSKRLGYSKAHYYFIKILVQFQKRFLYMDLQLGTKSIH
jgi:hypothetical protein